MVPVVVAPDDAVDFCGIDAAVAKDLGDAFLDGGFPPPGGDAFEDRGGEVVPVLTDAVSVRGNCENSSSSFVAFYMEMFGSEWGKAQKQRVWTAIRARRTQGRKGISGL